MHHEDLRRGRPGWQPRSADPECDEQLWMWAGRVGRLMYRRSPVGVTLRRPDGAERVVRAGRGAVAVVGEPGELVLHAFGRSAVRVELDGAPADVATLSTVPRGL